jgi:hypothetical protein
MTGADIIQFPTTRRAPYPSPRLLPGDTPAKVSRALIDRAIALDWERQANEPRRGVGHGQRQFWPTISQSSRAWVAAAKEVRATEERLNRLLPAEGHERGRVPGDHADPDSPEVAEAFADYRRALASLLQCPDVKARHVLDLLRAAAELMEIQDPVWAHIDTAASQQEQVFAYAVHRVRKVLDL